MHYDNKYKIYHIQFTQNIYPMDKTTSCQIMTRTLSHQLRICGKQPDHSSIEKAVTDKKASSQLYLFSIRLLHIIVVY